VAGNIYVDSFIWLPGVVEKLATKHQVSQDEVEEVFFDLPHYRFAESGHRQGEDVLSAQGQTEAGRYLIVFFILKPENAALTISARDMTPTERRRYERK